MDELIKLLKKLDLKDESLILKIALILIEKEHYSLYHHYIYEFCDQFKLLLSDASLLKIAYAFMAKDEKYNSFPFLKIREPINWIKIGLRINGMNEAEIDSLFKELDFNNENDRKRIVRLFNDPQLILKYLKHFKFNDQEILCELADKCVNLEKFNENFQEFKIESVDKRYELAKRAFEFSPRFFYLKDFNLTSDQNYQILDRHAKEIPKDVFRTINFAEFSREKNLEILIKLLKASPQIYFSQDVMEKIFQFLNKGNLKEVEEILSLGADRDPDKVTHKADLLNSLEEEKRVQILLKCLKNGASLWETTLYKCHLTHENKLKLIFAYLNNPEHIKSFIRDFKKYGITSDQDKIAILFRCFEINPGFMEEHWQDLKIQDTLSLFIQFCHKLPSKFTDYEEFNLPKDNAEFLDNLIVKKDLTFLKEFPEYVGNILKALNKPNDSLKFEKTRQFLGFLLLIKNYLNFNLDDQALWSKIITYPDPSMRFKLAFLVGGQKGVAPRKERTRGFLNFTCQVIKAI